MTTRFDLGAIILDKMDKKAFDKIMSSLKDIAPDFADHLIENFGDNYSRPYLNIKERELVALAFLLSQGQTKCFESHALRAMNCGVTINEILETIMQSSFYNGFPKSFEALLKIKEIVKSHPTKLRYPTTEEKPEKEGTSPALRPWDER